MGKEREIAKIFCWFRVEALFEEGEEFSMCGSSGCVSLVYSYRVKYSDLLAPFFLSSREMLLNELMIPNFTFSCGFSGLVKADLDKALLWVFSF